MIKMLGQRANILMAITGKWAIHGSRYSNLELLSVLIMWAFGEGRSVE